MDELHALELVISGVTHHYDLCKQINLGGMQISNFREFPRGLCAIVCYYDMHRYYCLVLKSLLAFHANPPITNESSIKLRHITSEILADRSLLPSLVDVLANFTVVQEFERLNNPRTNGLGGQSHQEMLALLIKEIEQHSYEIICLLALYGPAEIQKDSLAKLFDSVRQFNPRNAFSHYQLTLWTALLLVINPARLKQQCERKLCTY